MHCHYTSSSDHVDVFHAYSVPACSKCLELNGRLLVRVEVFPRLGRGSIHPPKDFRTKGLEKRRMAQGLVVHDVVGCPLSLSHRPPDLIKY